jgi:hypothetical protein
VVAMELLGGPEDGNVAGLEMGLHRELHLLSTFARMLIAHMWNAPNVRSGAGAPSSLGKLTSRYREAMSGKLSRNQASSKPTASYHVW